MEPDMEALMRTAREQDVVTGLTLDNGMHMFVFPLPLRGFLVGVGYEQAHDVRPDVVLRRRGADIERYGRWLPALFADGSWYLIQRLGTGDLSEEFPEFSQEELDAAKELLS